jgi:hypothetical protein
MSGWTFSWLAWGLMFCAIEGAALIQKAPGATLSEHLRAIFSTMNKSAGWRFRRFCLLATLTGLAGHLIGWL